MHLEELFCRGSLSGVHLKALLEEFLTSVRDVSWQGVGETLSANRKEAEERRLMIGRVALEQLQHAHRE